MGDRGAEAWPPFGRRISAWRQTPERRVTGPDEAAKLIDEVAIATVYPASPEVANLFHAHVGDPERKTDSKWDSPSGEVYAWRWVIGKRAKHFYGTVVRKRPTFVSLPLLPAILKLVADLRAPDELFDFGVISSDAYKIAQVLEGCGEPMSTGDIRKAADFPTGRDHSARYHKGLAELENRLLITTQFKPDQDEDGSKRHGLMFERRREEVDAAEKLTADQAVDTLLKAYLRASEYVVPDVFARHMRVDQGALMAGITRFQSEGILDPVDAPGVRGSVFVRSQTSGA